MEISEIKDITTKRQKENVLLLRFASLSFRRGDYKVNNKFWGVMENIEKMFSNPYKDEEEFRSLVEEAFFFGEEATDDRGHKYKFF
jgi:hypothetical protein